MFFELPERLGETPQRSFIKSSKDETMNTRRITFGTKAQFTDLMANKKIRDIIIPEDVHYFASQKENSDNYLGSSSGEDEEEPSETEIKRKKAFQTQISAWPILRIKRDFYSIMNVSPELNSILADKAILLQYFVINDPKHIKTAANLHMYDKFFSLPSLDSSKSLRVHHGLIETKKDNLATQDGDNRQLMAKNSRKATEKLRIAVARVSASFSLFRILTEKGAILGLRDEDPHQGWGYLFQGVDALHILSAGLCLVLLCCRLISLKMIFEDDL